MVGNLIRFHLCVDCTVEMRVFDNGDVQVILREETGVVDVSVVSLSADLERGVEPFVSRVECCLSCRRINYCYRSIVILCNDSCAVGDVEVRDARSGVEHVFQERWRRTT